uniref:Calmodulin n=1 Tax=Strombidinopsis acuminata TaxID=141414 RepID=A0A7S3WVW5_9SPIT
MADAQEHEGLTNNEIAKLTEAFSIWDKQQQGYIPWNPDFPALWRSIGQNPTEAELKEIRDVKDKGTGHFDQEQFLKICESDNPRYMKDPVRPEQLIEAFKTFDKDGKGTLTIGQLRYMVQCLGDKLEDAEADEFISFVMAKCKTEDSDEISYEDIVDQLMERDPKNV